MKGEYYETPATYVFCSFEKAHSYNKFVAFLGLISGLHCYDILNKMLYNEVKTL